MRLWKTLQEFLEIVAAFISIFQLIDSILPSEQFFIVVGSVAPYLSFFFVRSSKGIFIPFQIPPLETLDQLHSRILGVFHISS